MNVTSAATVLDVRKRDCTSTAALSDSASTGGIGRGVGQAVGKTATSAAGSDRSERKFLKLLYTSDCVKNIGETIFLAR